MIELSPISKQYKLNLPNHDCYIFIKIKKMGNKWQQPAPNTPTNIIDLSSEHNGVNCYYCNILLPPNNWKFDQLLGFLCFYDVAESGNISSFALGTGTVSSIPVINGNKLYKYFRKDHQWRYLCSPCLSKIQTKDVVRSLDLLIQGKGIVVSPNLVKDPNEITFTSLDKGIRLSGHPDGKVDTNRNNLYWEKWQIQQISEDKYYVKSKTHKTYLRAYPYPDGKLELTAIKDEWGIWTKKDYGHGCTWKSYNCLYLSCDQKGSAFLSPNETKNEFWIDI